MHILSHVVINCICRKMALVYLHLGRQWHILRVCKSPRELCLSQGKLNCLNCLNLSFCSLPLPLGPCFLKVNVWKKQKSWWWQQMLIQLCVLFSCPCHTSEICAIHTGKCVRKTQAFLHTITEKNWSRRSGSIYLKVSVRQSKLKRKISCNSSELNLDLTHWWCWLVLTCIFLHLFRYGRNTLEKVVERAFPFYLFISFSCRQKL